MKVSGMFRPAITVMVASAAFALAGCETMKSGMDSTMAYFTDNVTLSGAEEVPPVKTAGSGSGTITVKDDKSVSGSVTIKGFTASAAHIHMGPPSCVCPVIIPLTKSTDGNTWSVPAGAKLTDAQYEAYKAGNLYVNVHSAANKSGEVRGRLKP